jgi:hypothetical protein
MMVMAPNLASLGTPEGAPPLAARRSRFRGG